MKIRRQYLYSPLSFSVIAAFSFLFVSNPAAISATGLPGLRLVPKPADDVVEQRPRPQPTVPDNAKEIPFKETAPEPVLTPEEKERGYLLFQRPIMECVYPNTHPLSHERIESLTAFATPGEFEPITLALYPVRSLKNLKVCVSSLKTDSGEIPADLVEIRLATYWNVGYPSYTTVNTYRRTPELLERVTVHSSPPGECQWYWLTVHVPGNAKPGIYQGTVNVWDDGFDKALQIPLALRVLEFPLQKDPKKHFSAYFYVRNRALYKGRDETFIRQAADKDYQAMQDFGLDMLPTLYLSCEDGKRIVLSNANEIERMLAAGLKGPAPVIADNVIYRIYRDTTPEGKQGSHWRISPMPQSKFYERVTELFKVFELERKAKGWPEFIYCPLDEVDVSCKEFGSKVYASVKAAGVRTYATKDPQEFDAADYTSYLDIWCSQPYSVSYDRITSQNRFEYWCYPNHNAGEIKDRRTMCKGGRMTYGFGFWRSGYTTLIPWQWCWASEQDPFDYLRGGFSGGGQRMDNDGNVIPAVYWECFREGYDDARYLYTLQQAIVQREDSKDPACLKAVEEGRRLLHETWNDIHVQPRYLADGMWPSEEFNTIRWLLASQIQRLLPYPASGQAIASSVLPCVPIASKVNGKTSSPYELDTQSEGLEHLDLGNDFADWKSGTVEGKTEILEGVGHDRTTGLRWTVTIDHQNDGGEGGNYPVGWPRLGRNFKPGELDLTTYDMLVFWIRIDSNRDEMSDNHTPLGLIISSHSKKSALYQLSKDFGNEQRVWIPLRFPLKQIISTSDAGLDPWKSISRLQLNISEHNYAHGTRLIFDIGEVSVVRFKTPMLTEIEAPHHILLPRKSLPFDFSVFGTGTSVKGSYSIAASLESGGVSHAEFRQKLEEPYRMALTLPTMRPGPYTLRLKILDADGKKYSGCERVITAHAGPLY